MSYTKERMNRAGRCKAYYKLVDHINQHRFVLIANKFIRDYQARTIFAFRLAHHSLKRRLYIIIHHFLFLASFLFRRSLNRAREIYARKSPTVVITITITTR